MDYIRIRSFQYVANLINCENNIVDQLKILSKYKHRRGVRKFIDNLILSTYLDDDDDETSRYILYCVCKYYYGLDAKEVKEPIPNSLPIVTPSTNYNIKMIRKLLCSKDNIIDQCKLLKEHKDSKNVQNYIESVIYYYTYYDFDSDYQKYCIDKYFLDLDVEEVKPPHVTLYAYIRARRDKHEIYEDVENYIPFSELKILDKVEILNGPFKGIEGTITNISEDFHEVHLDAIIFNEVTPIVLDDVNRMRKIIND